MLSVISSIYILVSFIDAIRSKRYEINYQICIGCFCHIQYFWRIDFELAITIACANCKSSIDMEIIQWIIVLAPKWYHNCGVIYARSFGNGKPFWLNSIEIAFFSFFQWFSILCVNYSEQRQKKLLSLRCGLDVFPIYCHQSHGNLNEFLFMVTFVYLRDHNWMKNGTIDIDTRFNVIRAKVILKTVM